MDKGELIVISGPSGVGKSTVVRKLVAECPLPMELSVSATTREPRPGETDGIDYIFLSSDEFERRRENGDFLEWAEVFESGFWYGTLRGPVTTGLIQGKWIILEIDVAGAMQVAQHYPDAITIFIHPGDEEKLERRLRGRRTESEEEIQRRLRSARHELTFADRYQHVVVNDDLDTTVKNICQILSDTGVSK